VWTTSARLGPVDDPADAARRILEDNRYAVLATVDAAGEPWATPVWFAHRGLDVLLWVSSPDAQHSQALASVPRLAVTVFDSGVEPGHGTAFYGRGRAGACPEEELADHLATFSGQGVAQGLRAWGVEDVSGAARHRLYVAHLDELSVLLDVEGPERRVPIARDR
jgi:nitroimidazol reductase NimA-like FMN-containing flavoprotein (pyridoxamine 5'-phosphate oxidase superfamily)